MAFTRCILFTRYTREQNTTCKGHLAFQKATISLENDVHSFFFLSLTFITINVRHIQSTLILSNIYIIVPFLQTINSKLNNFYYPITSIYTICQEGATEPFYYLSILILGNTYLVGT